MVCLPSHAQPAYGKEGIEDKQEKRGDDSRSLSPKVTHDLAIHQQE